MKMTKFEIVLEILEIIGVLLVVQAGRDGLELLKMNGLYSQKVKRLAITLSVILLLVGAGVSGLDVTTYGTKMTGTPLTLLLFIIALIAGITLSNVLSKRDKGKKHN